MLGLCIAVSNYSIPPPANTMIISPLIRRSPHPKAFSPSMIQSQNLYPDLARPEVLLEQSASKICGI